MNNVKPYGWVKNANFKGIIESTLHMKFKSTDSNKKIFMGTSALNALKHAPVKHKLLPGEDFCCIFLNKLFEAKYK